MARTRKTWKDYACGYETPRQRRIRHNWPVLSHLLTKAEKEQHEQIVRDIEAREKR